MTEVTEATAPDVLVARGASYLFTEGVFANVMGVIFLAYAARMLPVTEVGVLSALVMVTSFFVTFGTWSIPSATAKFISEFMGSGRQDIAREVYKKVLRFGFLISLLLAFLCFGSSNVISAFLFHNQDYQLLIIILGLYVFALLLSSFLNGTLLGIQKFREMAFAGVITTSARFGGSLFLLTQGFGLAGVLVGWVMGSFVGLGLLSFFTLTSFQSTKERTSYPLMEILRFSTPLQASAMLSYFSGTIDKYVLLFMVGFTSLGIYSVALSATVPVGLVGSSINSSLFSQFSRMYGGHGAESLREASRKASRYVFFIYIPVAVGLAVISYPTIALFVGKQYESGWLPLTILSMTMALTSAGVVTSSLLLSLGSTRTFLEANILGVVVGSMLSVLLVAPLGIVGMAFARAALTAIAFVYSIFRLKKLFGLYFDSNSFRNAWAGSIVMALTVAVLEFFWMNRSLLPLYIVVGGSVYVAMLRFTNAINGQDILLMKQFLPKRLNKAAGISARLLGIKQTKKPER